MPWDALKQSSGRVRTFVWVLLEQNTGSQKMSLQTMLSTVQNIVTESLVSGIIIHLVRSSNLWWSTESCPANYGDQPTQAAPRILALMVQVEHTGTSSAGDLIGFSCYQVRQVEWWPQKRCLCFIQGPCGNDLIWKKALCTCSSYWRDLGMRSSCIIWVGLAGVFISGLWPIALRGNELVLFSVTQCLVICHSNPRELL